MESCRLQGQEADFSICLIRNTNAERKQKDVRQTCNHVKRENVLRHPQMWLEVLDRKIYSL